MVLFETRSVLNYISCLKRGFFVANCKNVIKNEEEFRMLIIPGHTKIFESKQNIRRKRMKVFPPRYQYMKINQDWSTSWPFAKSFCWSITPFPVRMGYVEKSENEGVVPSKYGNAELMKIPNFLHLTPNHVKKHCDALKRFCTPWPKGLENNKLCRKLFPLSITYSDYVNDGSSPANEKARNILMTVKLSALSLDDLSRDKFIRLAGRYYNKESDLISISIDRCPTKKQNYDYCIYLLTALCQESKKRESWEKEKSLEDMEQYVWSMNKSKTNMENFIKSKNMSKKKSNDLEAYGESVEKLLNGKENLINIMDYKKIVKGILNV